MGLFDGLKNQSRKPKDQEGNAAESEQIGYNPENAPVIERDQMFHVKHPLFLPPRKIFKLTHTRMNPLLLRRYIPRLRSVRMLKRNP